MGRRGQRKPSVAAVAVGLVCVIGCAPALAKSDKGAGTGNRDWVPGPASAPPALESPASYRVVETDDLTMQARDGTSLAYNLYLPKDAPVGPCLLIREGYGKASGNTQSAAKEILEKYMKRPR